MKRVLLLAAALFMVAGMAHADLIGHWTFDSDVTDEVSATAGTLEGDASINTSDAHLGGGCLEVSDGYADAGVNLNLAGPFTMAAWVQFEGDVTGTVVGDNHFDNAGGRLLSVDGAGIYTDIGWVAAHSGDAAGLNDGTWHHIAWTQAADGTSILYYDGDVADEGSYDVTEEFETDLEDTLWVGSGGFYEDAPFQFVGLIDDVQVYDEILDEAGIEEAMEGLGAAAPEASISGPHSVPSGTPVTLTAVATGFDEGTETYAWDGGPATAEYDLGTPADGVHVYSCTVGGDVGEVAADPIVASFTLWVAVATPLAGGLGLGLLAGACALAGVVSIRRKK
jgi:hypothetical protein